MLRSVVYDFGSQIGRAPGAQRCREKNKQATKDDYYSGKPFSLRLPGITDGAIKCRSAAMNGTWSKTERQNPAK